MFNRLEFLHTDSMFLRPQFDDSVWKVGKNIFTWDLDQDVTVHNLTFSQQCVRIQLNIETFGIELRARDLIHVVADQMLCYLHHVQLMLTLNTSLFHRSWVRFFKISINYLTPPLPQSSIEHIHSFKARHTLLKHFIRRSTFRSARGRRALMNPEGTPLKSLPQTEHNTRGSRGDVGASGKHY